jgi:hypothetical protein
VLLIVGVLTVLAGAGAWLGWYQGTKPLYRRSDDPMDAPFLRRGSASPRLSRLKRQRVLLTVFYAVGAAIGGVALMVYLVR